MEKSVNADIAKSVFELLKNDGYHVSLICNNGPLLKIKDRIQLIKQLKSDLFISIHADSFSYKALEGPRIYFYRNGNVKSEKLAKSVKKGTMKEDLSFDDRFFISKYGIRNGSFRLLKANEKPAIIIEVGFLTTKNDNHNLSLKQYRDFMARGIYRGIRNFLQQR